MEQFYFHFIATMLHSLWQSALLLLFYAFLLLAKPRLAPLSKRNILLSLLLVQILYSIATFCLLVTNPTQGLLVFIADSIGPLLEQSWLQENAYPIFIAYLLFVVGRMAISYWQWNNFKTDYKRSLQKAPLDLRLFTQTKAYEFGLSRKVSLWCSDFICTPMTFGFWRPIILMPVSLLNHLSIEQAEALIIHELTHIRHRDYLLNWAMIGAETLFFFNPFIRFIVKRIKMERERNCDVQVLNFKYGNILYAEALLKASQVQQQLKVQLTAAGSRKQLFQRITFFTQKENLRFQKTYRSVIIAGYLFTVLVTLLLALTFTQKRLPATVYSNVHQELAQAKPVYNGEKNVAFQAMSLVTKQGTVSGKKPRQQKAASRKSKAAYERQDPSQAFREDESPSLYAMPASSEDIKVEGEEIIIKEEGSDGKKITAAYHAILINGLWTLQPMWLITETPPTGDSSKLKVKDSTQYKRARVQ